MEYAFFFRKRTNFFSKVIVCISESILKGNKCKPQAVYIYDNSEDGTELVCPKCGTPVYIGNRHELISRCLKALNRDIFKDATLIRLDDWYIPELKEKRSPSPNYRLTVYIKTDKDEDTIVVLYVSYVGSGNKVQYFIKPEKGQLTSDHKDMDPSKIISKIEVTLKDRKLSQEYDSE